MDDAAAIEAESQAPIDNRHQHYHPYDHSPTAYFLDCSNILELENLLIRKHSQGYGQTLLTVCES